VRTVPSQVRAGLLNGLVSSTTQGSGYLLARICFEGVRNREHADSEVVDDDRRRGTRQTKLGLVDSCAMPSLRILRSSMTSSLTSVVECGVIIGMGGSNSFPTSMRISFRRVYRVALLWATGHT
jgi:hypothetical protein